MTALTTGKHFSVFETGAVAQWPAHDVELPGIGTLPGKQFLKDALNLTSCEISVNAMPVGAGMPFIHDHQQNEEVYIFIGGEGQVKVDDTEVDVKEGSIVRIAPGGERLWRNTGNTPLQYIVIQAKAGSLTQFGLADATAPDKPVVWNS